MNDIIEPQMPAAMNIATISAGFEKGDFLVREEQGNRVYFDFFEEVCFLCSEVHHRVYLVSLRCVLTSFSLYFDSIRLSKAFNYISNKGYARMSREDEKHWVDLMNVIHDSVKGGMKYNTGTLLMVLSRPVGTEASASKDTKAKTPSKDGKVMNP